MANERTIIDVLGLDNPWWEGIDRFPQDKVKPFKRSDFWYLLNSHRERKECIVIVGPRGVGKSTTMYEIMHTGIKDQKKPIDARRILYASMSNPLVKKTPIFEILKIYSKYLLREDIAKLTKHIYVYLDEVQELNWGEQIKTIMDLGYPIKFIVTGSSSTAMMEEATKAARRVIVYPMLPFKFSDYSKYRINNEKFNEAIKRIRSIRHRLPGEFRDGKAEKIYESFVESYAEVREWVTDIQLCFDDYLVKGGYPGIFDISDEKQYQDIIQQSFWLGFHKDLALAKGVGDPIGMRQLVEYIATTSSCDTNYTSLMKNSQSATNTEMVKKYLYHLERAFLVKLSHQYSKSASKKTQFKIYLCDIAIRNLLVGVMNQLFFKNQQQQGYAIQTLIFEHTMRLSFKFTGKPDLNYWKDENGGQEVDIIMNLKDTVVPIEVKKNDEPSIDDVKGLTDFCNGKPGIVVCGKKLSIEKNIIFVPHWLYCLIC